MGLDPLKGSDAVTLQSSSPSSIQSVNLGGLLQHAAFQKCCLDKWTLRVLVSAVRGGTAMDISR